MAGEAKITFRSMPDELLEEIESPLKLIKESKAFIMRNITYSDFRKIMDNRFGTGAGVIFYEVGLGCGERSCKRLMKRHRDKHSLFKALSQYKREEGWGEIDFSQLHPETGLGRIIVRKSFEARQYQSEQPSCHFLRGYLEGFLKEAYRKDVKVIEINCLAKGDAYCTFQASSEG